MVCDLREGAERDLPAILETQPWMPSGPDCRGEASAAAPTSRQQLSRFPSTAAVPPPPDGTMVRTIRSEPIRLKPILRRAPAIPERIYRSLRSDRTPVEIRLRFQNHVILKVQLREHRGYLTLPVCIVERPDRSWTP